ncbi:hypothetical protein EBS43_02020 [bacterium]|nr:hypothetical protein [bacterium]
MRRLMNPRLRPQILISMIFSGVILVTLPSCAKILYPAESIPAEDFPDEDTPSVVTHAAIGDNHACAILSNGLLSCWGSNRSGQLGDGTTTEELSPQITDEATEYSYVSLNTSIDEDEDHTCAITSEGALKCWGENSFGQLGIGSSITQLEPTLVDPSSTYKEVAVGGNPHTCAITTEGILKCWGHNDYGQLGNNNFSDQNTPQIIDSGVTYSSIATGQYHTCGITSSGALKCWGNNTDGQLGDGSLVYKLSPTPVYGGGIYSAVALGAWHTCAINQTGELYCWGDNSSGQLGNESNSPTIIPQPIDPTERYREIALGYTHTCGITISGTLKCWGDNTFGQLGDGTTTDRNKPVTIDANTTYTSVFSSSSSDSTCAITSEDEFKCWGSNLNGQLGDGTSLFTLYSDTPMLVDSATTYQVVSSGAQHTCAKTTSGKIRCWGSNLYGQLGDGTHNLSNTPINIDSSTTYLNIEVGYTYTCGLTLSGEIKCWGSNSFGQLGDGTQTDQLSPQVIPSVSYDPTTYFSSLSVGYLHTCGIWTDTTTPKTELKCWGDNTSDQLTSLAGDPQKIPITIDSGTEYTQVSAGWDHTCGITKDEQLKCWGRNLEGQLGDNSLTNRETPVTIGSDKYLSVSSGYDHTCAIQTDNKLYCWGENYAGQLGDNTITMISSPHPVDPDTEYSMVTTGKYHTCGITTLGVLKCWGLNLFGTLGDGTTTPRTSPTVIDSGILYHYVDAGPYNTCGITTIGHKLKCWGTNYFGQIGDGGEISLKLTPNLVEFNF